LDALKAEKKDEERKVGALLKEDLSSQQGGRVGKFFQSFYREGENVYDN